MREENARQIDTAHRYENQGGSSLPDYHKVETQRGTDVTPGAEVRILCTYHSVGCASETHLQCFWNCQHHSWRCNLTHIYDHSNTKVVKPRFLSNIICTVLKRLAGNAHRSRCLRIRLTCIASNEMSTIINRTAFRAARGRLFAKANAT